MNPLRFARTIRHIPPHMLTARIAYRARTLLYSSPIYSFMQEVETPPKKLNLPPPNLWQGSKSCCNHILNGTFTFQNTTQTITTNLTDPLLATPVNWLPNNTTHLWQFTLHYFEWLNDLAAHKTQTSRQAAQTLVADWLLEHDSFHPIIWHPYPTSLRLVSWFTHAEWLLKDADKPLEEAFMSSLVRQTNHLEKNCETWLGGNHLLKNLKALIYAGLCLPNRHALFWRSLEKFMTELTAQILPDGAHNERSPSYHVQVLRDVLDVHALIIKAGHTPPPALFEILERMASALGCYQNPDGTLPLFNDGETLTKQEIAHLLKRCGGISDTPTALPEAGYARLTCTKKIAAPLNIFFDAGAIGPTENPGHAHADTLAFELFLGTEKIFTNQGTYLYQHAARNHYRSTEAHNTLDVNGTNSSEIWSAFRVGRRPTKITLNITGHKNTKKELTHTATGSHNGYAHLGLTHTRTLTLTPEGTLQGQDKLIAHTTKAQHNKITAHFHLHPDVTLKMLNEREAELRAPTGKKLLFKIEKGRFIQQTYDHAPKLGQRLPAQKLIVSIPLKKPRKKQKEQTTTFNWEILTL